jgi:F0F1-type ATP synthase delta subunit
MNSKIKSRLQKKLEKKNGKDPKNLKEKDEFPDLFNMLNDVNKILKSNPGMVKKVSKCVNDIMGNKELIESLTKQINIQTENESETESPGDQISSTSDA